MSDSGNEPTYSLDELTALAATTPRTVRYYIAEGLLPPAVSAGPRSGYTEGHLDRLRLIGRMKETYLPLREIRQRLGNLDDAEVRDTLRALDAATAGTAPSPPLTSAEVPIGGRVPEHAAPPPAVRPPRRADTLTPAPPPYDTWRRLPITTEAELLIRDEAYRRRADQIEALITWARRILS